MSQDKFDLSNLTSYFLPEFLMPGALKTTTPTGFIIYPQELRAGKPHRADRLYKGEFALEAGVARCDTTSPFDIIPPHPQWKKELLSFSWLRDLRAKEFEGKKSRSAKNNIGLSTIQARTLVHDWIGKQDGESSPETKARRLISWIYNADFLLKNDNGIFADFFLKSIGQQIKLLNKITPHQVPENQKLTCLTALCFASVCLEGMEKTLAKKIEPFGVQIRKEILPDGGHISRNPERLILILLDFIPLLSAYQARSKPAPRELVNAVDRMFPMLRFFILGDKGLSQFNGASMLHKSLAAFMLKADNIEGKPLSHASHSGYHRIEKGTTVIVFDTGGNPPREFGHLSHASRLAFEMSSDTYRLIVNCGGAHPQHEEWHEVAKSTAAHSTLVIDDTSQATQSQGSIFKFGQKDSDPLQTGQKNNQNKSDQGHLVVTTHDGYLDHFGIKHERTLYLASSGKDLRGEDCLHLAGAEKTSARNFAIRFHLHPDVKVTQLKKGKHIHLLLPNKSAWNFISSGAKISIEDSIYLTERDKPKKTSQIVLHGPVRDQKTVKWALKFIGKPRASKSRNAHKNEPNLPFED